MQMNSTPTSICSCLIRSIVHCRWRYSIERHKVSHILKYQFFQVVSSNGEIGVVMDDEAGGFDGEAFPSGSVTENWSDQLTMKVKVILMPICCCLHC